MHRRTVVRMLLGTATLWMAAGCRGSRAEPGTIQRDFYVCDGCEAVPERSPADLDWNADIALVGEPGEQLVLSGVVYRPDGRTPASDVVIYAHHTNAEGLYANGTSETIWSRRHGRLRSWVKTGTDGRYEFRTIKPGVYPNRRDPAHIHLFIAEPGRRPYYIDDVVFAGEFGVDENYRARRTGRGGPGIVALARDKDGTWLARRNIVLEVHP